MCDLEMGNGHSSEARFLAEEYMLFGSIYCWNTVEKKVKAITSLFKKIHLPSGTCLSYAWPSPVSLLAVTAVADCINPELQLKTLSFGNICASQLVFKGL